MRRINKGEPGYDESRRIANARFDLQPSAVLYCGNEEDVKQAVSQAAAAGKKIRVRSGGHHHEGMCSGDGVTIIDVSLLNCIDFVDGGATVKMGPGAKLGDVYTAVRKAGRLFAGGGCGDVRAGGLTQGGGWGLYSRYRGLTCDQLKGCRMVMINGQVLEVRDDTPHDLMWAVRGAGGGNFGVVTELLFDLVPYTGPIIQFTVSWTDASLVRQVLEEWRDHFPDHPDDKLTSFCRVLASGTSDPPILVAGSYLGEQTTLEGLLESMLPNTYAKGKHKFDPVPIVPPAAEERRLVQHPAYQPGPPAAAVRALKGLGDAPPTDLSTTCDGAWYPHKVSSTFPVDPFPNEALDTIVKFINDSESEAGARRYLSLHSLGGAVNRKIESCFPYRSKKFMLQYQAWWADRHDKALEQRCKDWVAGFRKALKDPDNRKDYTEGSFINFPDKDLVPDPDTPEGRRDLLAIYYTRTGLDMLMRTKRAYVPESIPVDIFDFPMGIPRR